MTHARILIFAVVALLTSAVSASAQSTCSLIVPGAVLTAAQWNLCFQGKQDFVAPLPATTTQVVLAGNVTVLCQDGLIILNKASASATAVTLPAASCHFDGAGNPIPLSIYDWAGNAGPITITPAGSDLIMGAATKVVTSGGTPGTGGTAILIPNSAMAGWLAR